MFLSDGDFTILFSPTCFGTRTRPPCGASVFIWGTVFGGLLLFSAPGISTGDGITGAGAGAGAGAGIALGVSAVLGVAGPTASTQDFGQDITTTVSTITGLSSMGTEIP